MPTARKTYHHGNLRRVLLDAAMHLFVERGSFEFTLRELAREAGVTHNAPYRHFAGKHELLAALREEGFLALEAACREALSRTREKDDDHRARVRVLGEAYVRFAVEHRDVFRLMLDNPRGVDEAPGSSPRRAAPPRAVAFDMLHDAIDAAREAGSVRRDLSTREIALAAWSLVHGLASLLVEGHVPASEARLRGYVKVLDAIFFEGAEG